MRKIITCMILGLLSLVSCTEYDEVAMWNKNEDMGSRLAALEGNYRVLPGHDRETTFQQKRSGDDLSREKGRKWAERYDPCNRCRTGYRRTLLLDARRRMAHGRRRKQDSGSGNGR